MAAVTLTLPAKQELPKNGSPLPMLVITGVDEDGTKRLEEVIPTLVGLAVGDTVEPITETINGRKIHSLPASALPWKTPLHYGRNGTTLIIGQDRKLVAASLGRELKDSLPAEPKVAAALKNHDHAALLGCVQWEPLLSQMLAEPADPKAKADETADSKPLTDLLAAAKPLPPLVVSLSRRDNEVRLLVRQPGLKESAAKLIDGSIDALMNGGSIKERMKQGIPAPAKN